MYIVLDLYSINEKFCILMTEVLKNLLKFFLFTFPTEAVTMMFQFINDLKDEPVRDLILTASLCRYLIILLARHEAGCVPLFSSLAPLFSRICKLPVQFQNGFDTVRMKSNRKPKIFNYLKYPANITSQFDSPYSPVPLDVRDDRSRRSFSVEFAPLFKTVTPESSMSI